MPEPEPSQSSPASARGRRAGRDRPATLRLIEQARARLPRSAWSMPRPFLVDATSASFRIDGIPVTVGQVTRALGHRQSVRAFRSSLSHRLRMHAAILCGLERLLANDAPLQSGHLMSWYAGLSAGHGTAVGVAEDARRAAAIVARVNAPTPRLAAAIPEVVALYTEVIGNPIVPSYNGIVARLLMHVHLGRCGLLPVIVEPPDDGFARRALDAATLLDLLARRYDLAGAL
jgi:hypothetical protein